jgi:hypothetical protein
MTEEEIKRVGDAVRRLGIPPFDPEPLGIPRFYRPDPFEVTAQTVEATLRNRDIEHQEQMQALLGEIYWCTTHLDEASARLRNIEFKLKKVHTA